MTSSQGALIDEMDFGYSSPSDSHSYISRQGEIVFRAFSGAEGLYSTANKSGSGWSFQQYLFDARGDTRAVATADGTVPLRSQPDEYGRASSSPNVRVPYEFMGKFQRFFNPLTGLVHMGARMYQPKTGRFLSRDPITGGSANDYEYTAGDPVNRRDLSGRHSFEECWAGRDESHGLGNAYYALYCIYHGHPDPNSIEIGGSFYNRWALREKFGGVNSRELGNTNLNRRLSDRDIYHAYFVMGFYFTGLSGSVIIPREPYLPDLELPRAEVPCSRPEEWGLIATSWDRPWFERLTRKSALNATRPSILVSGNTPRQGGAPWLSTR